MANSVSLPGDLVVPGNLRVAGNITPAMAKSSILAEASLQAFTVPMSLWRADLNGAPNDSTAGSGISLGSGTICSHHVSRQGGLIKTEIFIDVTGLNSGGTAGDIVGVTSETNCHIGQLSAAVNGTIVYGQITCLETPATGDDDIDFYSTVTESTGTQDVAISGLTGETAFTNSGDWTGAPATPELLSALPGVGYMYMVNQTTAATATYSAGQFLIELWGTPANNALEVVGGTHGTNAPSLQTPDFKNNSAAATYTARGELQLPWEYIAAGSVTVRLHAGLLTTDSDQACTVDLTVYKSDEDSTSTGDLCATAATDMNTTVFADLDFTITSSTLSPGDLLDVQISVSADNDDDTGAMKACIGSVQLLCDVR